MEWAGFSRRPQSEIDAHVNRQVAIATEREERNARDLIRIRTEMHRRNALEQDVFAERMLTNDRKLAEAERTARNMKREAEEERERTVRGEAEQREKEALAVHEWGREWRSRVPKSMKPPSKDAKAFAKHLDELVVDPDMPDHNPPATVTLAKDSGPIVTKE